MMPHHIPLWMICLLGYASAFWTMAICVVLMVATIRAQERRVLRAAQQPTEER